MRWAYILYNKCPSCYRRKLRFGKREGPYKLVTCVCGYYMDQHKFEILKKKIAAERGRLPLPTPV